MKKTEAVASRTQLILSFPLCFKWETPLYTAILSEDRYYYIYAAYK